MPAREVSRDVVGTAYKETAPNRVQAHASALTSASAVAMSRNPAGDVTGHLREHRRQAVRTTANRILTVSVVPVNRPFGRTRREEPGPASSTRGTGKTRRRTVVQAWSHPPIFITPGSVLRLVRFPTGREPMNAGTARCEVSQMRPTRPATLGSVSAGRGNEAGGARGYAPRNTIGLRPREAVRGARRVL